MVLLLILSIPFQIQCFFRFPIERLNSDFISAQFSLFFLQKTYTKRCIETILCVWFCSFIPYLLNNNNKLAVNLLQFPFNLSTLNDNWYIGYIYIETGENLRMTMTLIPARMWILNLSLGNGFLKSSEIQLEIAISSFRIQNKSILYSPSTSVQDFN